MKDLERRKFRTRNPQKEELQDLKECTFRPNTNKAKFVKYPNPPTIKNQEDTIL